MNLNSVVANDHTLLTLMDLNDCLLASLFILNDHESLRWPDCIILQVELFTTLTYEHITLAELALGITMIIQELVIRLRMNDMFSLTTLDHIERTVREVGVLHQARIAVRTARGSDTVHISPDLRLGPHHQAL